MEIGNGGASSKGGLIPVPDSSDVFKNSILAPLQSAYLYDESRQFFKYKSAVLVKNPTLERKYNAFRAKRREAGYSEEDLEESYGFLLFDDANKANALGETGALTGNSTCTTLGDPSKGVYISMYSDCLDLNRWYHGKSGYIAIIRLTKGKVKRVSENYTQNFTAPTVGFDCHVSEQLPSVSAQTSSFLAFERTQCYMYELLDDGSNAAAQSPSAVCPFAILSFSYTDTKATIAPPQEKCEEKKAVFYYLPWRGQLQIGSQLYNIGLRSTAGALIPTKLPPVVKVDRAISMVDLRQLLPKAVFETCFAGEVFLDGLYCSLYELVSTEAQETNSLGQLLWEIREKDLALAVMLSDGGFLILLHSSHFLTYDDAWSCTTEVLQGLFVFPDSRVVMKDTKFGQKKPSVTSEILQILPVLSYAEGEVEKTSIDPSEELCEVLAQHMQSYTALINPGLASSPSREVSMFPFQYDVPDAHLYSSPEWTDGAMQSFRSYLSRPVSFQLPVSRASEILVAGQEERRREDLDDDVYICLSSPEEAPQEMIDPQEMMDPVSTVLEDTLSDLKFPENVETSVENGTTSPGAQDDLTVVPHNVVTSDLQPGHFVKDNEKCSDLSELNKTEGVNDSTPPASDDLPAELIVSITSAEQSVSDETLNLRAKLQAEEVNSLCDETDYAKKLLDIPKVTSFTGTKLKMCTRLSKGSKNVSKASVEPSSLQTVKTVEVDSVNSQKDEHARELSDHPQLRNPSNWRKLQRRKRKCGKLSTRSRRLRSTIVASPIAEEKKTDPGLQSVESTILVELEVCPLRRKTERWDLKPIISECGRILVPHGATYFADQIKFLKDKREATKDEQSSEKTLLDAPVDADDTVKLDLESCTAPKTAMEEMEAAESVDGGSDLQNITASDINPKHNISKQLDIANSSLPLNPESNSSKNEHTETLPSQAVQEKHSDNLSPEKCPTKNEFLFRKLKSVLLKGKRKADLVTEDTPNTPQDTEPCLKKSKEVDSETEVLKSNDTNTPSTDAAVKEVPKMLPVDPLFVLALGLTPKVIPEKATKTGDRDTRQKTDPTKIQEQMISYKQPQIIHRPPSIFTRRGRIKTLKKHQSISAECIKKKWWLHFQTPACFASEKLKYKDSTSNNSVRKTEKTVNSAYSPADALNLLADLALSASNDQVPPQPNPSFESKPETSLKKSDLKKDLTSAEQESVLHALLRQSATRSIEPHESPAPSHLVCELVGLVSKEHAYSLPPSSSLLLGLPGTFPVSDSSGLLHHDQPMCGIKTLQPSVDQEDRSEHNRTPDYLKKRMVRKQKFRYSRTFVNKEGSIKVTRHWRENYDFNLDSKFTNDSKDKTVIRALHGPWDFSIQDTNEEVRLIVHMWIGLFYSRSTPRFFHVESNPCLEESDSLEMTSGMITSPSRSEHLATALVSFSSVTDTSDALISTALDLSKKNEDQDAVVLDLSLRNSSACLEFLTSPLQVSKKGALDSSEHKEPSETLNSVKSPRQLHEYSGKMVNLTDMENVRKPHEGEKTPRKTICLQNTDIPSFEGDGKAILLQKVIDCASIKPDAALAASGIGQVLHGCNEERTNLKEGTENSGTKERSLVKQDVMDSCTFVKHKKKMEAEDVVQTDEHEKNKSKNLAICERKEDPCQKANADPSQKVVCAADDSTEESNIFCNGNCLESEKLLSMEEHKEISQELHESFKGVLVCGPKYKEKLMKDDHLRKDRLDEKDDCLSAKNADKDVVYQPLPGKCNGPDLANQNYITQSNHQAQMNEQPSLANITKDACHDIPLKIPCSDAYAQDYSISGKVSHTPFGIKSVNTDSATKDISKTDIYLRDKVLKTPVLPVSTPQTKDNVEIKSQNKEMSDISTAQSDHEDQENKSTEKVLKDDKEQFQHQPDSPQCEVPKACEAQVSFTKETDLGTDETNEELDKSCTAVEIPFIGINGSGDDTVKAKDDNTADKQFQHQPHSPQCKASKLCEAQLGFMEKTDVRIEKTNVGLDKSCTGVEIPFFGIDGSREDSVQVKDDNATHKKTFQHQPDSPYCEVPKVCEAFTKETDLRTDETNEELDKSCTAVEIPFIGINGSGDDTVKAKDDNTADKQFQHQPHSPQCKASKLCEAQLGFMEKTDVRIEKTNVGLDKSCTGVEIPFFGIDGSREDSVQVKDDNATHKKTFQHQPDSPYCEVPKVCEAFTKETDLRTDETNEELDKSCTAVEIPFIGINGSGDDTVKAKDDNTADKQFQHQPHSPQCKASKLCEAQLGFMEKTDVRIEKTNEGLDKSCTGIEIPFIGIDGSREDSVQVKDDNATHKKTFQHQPDSPHCEVPKACEAQMSFTKETDFRTDKTNEGLDKSCTGVEISFTGIVGSGEDSVQAKDDKTADEHLQYQPHSPQCKASKVCDTQLAFTQKTDVRIAETNEGLDKSCTGVEIPFVGKDAAEKVTLQVKDDNATHKKTFQHQSHSPQCEAQVTFDKETDLRTDETNEGLDKKCTRVEIPFIGIDGSGENSVQVKDGNTADKQFQHQPHSLQSFVHFTKETILTAENKTNEGLDKGCTGIEIPLIGMQSSEEDTVQPHGSHPHDRSEEVVQSQEKIPFITDSSDPKAALPDEVCRTSQECRKQAEPCKILLLDVNESYGPIDLGSESDNRCPTPTIDEKPYGCLPSSSSSSSTSAFSGTETAKNLNNKSLSTISAPVNGELPCEQKLCHTSIVNTDSSPHQGLHPDLEARTLRVLQSIDKFLSISNHTEKSCQIQTPKIKEYVDQSTGPSSKYIPCSLALDKPSVDFKDKNIGKKKPAAVSASASQDLHKESSDHRLVSPFKNKLEEVLGVKLLLKKADSVSQEYFERVNIQEGKGQASHSYRLSPSAELLQVIKPSLDQERPKSISQSCVNHEPRPYSRRPVMAVKPSKNDESQADCFSIDVHIENPLKSKTPKTLVHSIPKSMLSEKRTKEKSRIHPVRLDDNQEASQLSCKNTWLPDVNSKSNSVEAKFDLLDLSYQCQRKDISEFITIPSSSPSMQTSQSAESSSKLVDGIQGFLINGSVEKDEQTVKKNIEMDFKDSSVSASVMGQRDGDSIDESLILEPQSSLVCTVYNNSHKRPYSFLEQVSQRCLQDDLTQASMEQECLIFSEQMKQVLKKSERWSIHQEDIHDNIRLSCSSPMTINFSNLDERLTDSLDQLGTSLIGQKIKVDLSDRKGLTEKTEEEKMCPGERSQNKDNNVEHDWVSDVTVECARLYEAKMHHVCAFKNVTSRAKHFQKNYTKTETSNHFDFCDQMKKEMDKTFRTNLNSVVKKSCRTKYRFYILATSDDVFFEQTKAQLEAEGHTAIQPSDFFLGEDSSSSSIIILRNEDIAEHICKVPHLVELKKSPGVQFAGIDEPDDVLNLTHQELFTQGGFIMFDRTALDDLSLCNMKKVSEILLELSKMEKWKWVLHYRDSRRIKENARLSAEAKEKKHFLYWGQDAGLLEVLPYHECDQMSKDQPDYLACLVRLQVQKISSRYPVFITDAAMDSAFEKNGILTMTSNSFLTKPLSEMFTA